MALLLSATCAPAEPDDGLLARGEEFYREQCRICHVGWNRLAPNLKGIIGREAGKADDFDYFSDAFRAVEFYWNETTLDGYLLDPRMMVPGNRMAYYGMEDDEDRAALVAYIVEWSAR